MKLPLALVALVSIFFTSSASAVTYPDWRAANFTPAQLGDANLSGATADPDGDGVKNLAEYVFFGQPLTVDTNLETTAQIVNGHFALTYRERQGMTDVSIRLQGSDTLQNWITYNTVTEADRENFTGYDEVTLIDPAPFTQRRFVRLRLDLLPVNEPLAPTQLALTVITPTTFALTWTDPNTTETGYAVERRLPTSVWERLVTLGSDVGGWQHTAADYQTSMTYRVVAIGANNHEVASDPITLPDTDADGIPNDLELKESYAGVAGTFASDPNQFSSNGSGVSDGWLVANGFNPTQPFDGEKDTDEDGISDAEEARRGTNPHSSDTDNDGVPDAEDGWPRDPALKKPILPEVHYAIIRLRNFGITEEMWPDEIDDSGNVLFWTGRESYGEDRLKAYYWQAFTGNITLVPFFYDSSGPIDYSDGENQNNFTAIGESYTWDNLSPDGRVSGAIINEIQCLQAATWTVGGGIVVKNVNPPIQAQYLTSYSYITTTNRSGVSAGIEYGVGFNFSLTSTPDTSIGYRQGLFFPNAGTATVIHEPFISNYDYHSGVSTIQSSPSYFTPQKINDQGLIIGIIKHYAIGPNGIYEINASSEGAIFTDGQIHTFGKKVAPVALTSADLPVILGYNGNTTRAWRAVKTETGWDEGVLSIWDSQNQSEDTGAYVYGANENLEIISYNKIIRNGVSHPFTDLMPAGWKDVYSYDINNHGVILAEATRTLDDQGLPITDPQSEPVLLVPVELTSEDRLIKGSITIPEGWTNVSLSLRSTAQGGLDLGTFAGLEPGVTNSPTLIYASEDDILSEAELDRQTAGTIDPRANTQKVVFYRDATDPRRLHFATAFDQVGEIEIALSFGSGTTPATARLKHTLTAQAETAGLISTLDQRIQSPNIPEVVDFDLDTDGDGIPDGGPADLITASQPGTMAAPGAYVSEAAEDDPLNLVLLVNSDDDNADGQPDSANSSLDAADDDLARIVLRAPANLASPTGTLTLTHTGGSALRLRFATGQALASGAAVNLGSPSGPLAGLAAGPVTLYAEGLAPAGDVAITLTYTPPAGAPVADTVHLTVIDPASLASLQTRHRYFAQPGDLTGLVARSYATNGAYRQHRLGLSPVGDYIPLQNRTLLAKAMFPVVGAIKTTAAFYRGAANGFWLGLKGDWQGLQDAGTAAGSVIAYLFVEDTSGRMARAVAVYDLVRELGQAAKELNPAVVTVYFFGGGMVTTLTRDLYTDAEAALGWEPLTPGLDPQVLAYMGGIVVGYASEQVSVGLVSGAIAVKLTTKIGPVIKGVTTAFKAGTRYSLEMLDDAAKASVKLQRALVRVAATEEEASAATHAVQKARLIELPGGVKAPQVINNWFKTRPQLYEALLQIWSDKLPINVSDQRLTNMINDLASVLHRFGNNPMLSDDAMKGFAHVQAKLFKVGEDNFSRWKDMENLFGSLDTPAKRAAMNESLAAYKEAAELNPTAKFWLKNFSAVSNEAYHYSPNLKRLEGAGSFRLTAYQGERGWYATTSKFNEIGEAAGKLQLPELENARYRIKFSTSEAEGHLKVPKGFQNTESHFEPVTRDFPDLGPGSAPQMLLENKAVSVLEVYDTVNGRNLTNGEIQDLINL